MMFLCASVTVRRSTFIVIYPGKDLSSAWGRTSGGFFAEGCRALMFTENAGVGAWGAVWVLEDGSLSFQESAGSAYANLGSAGYGA